MKRGIYICALSFYLSACRSIYLSISCFCPLSYKNYAWPFVAKKGNTKYKIVKPSDPINIQRKQSRKTKVLHILLPPPPPSSLPPSLLLLPPSLSLRDLNNLSLEFKKFSKCKTEETNSKANWDILQLFISKYQ